MFCYLACVPVRDRKSVFSVLQYSTFSFFILPCFSQWADRTGLDEVKKHSLDASLYIKLHCTTKGHIK